MNCKTCGPDGCSDRVACPRAAISDAVQQAAKPVASMWQHVETGDTRIVPVGSIATISNHFRFIGALYLHPADHVEDLRGMVDPAAPIAQEQDVWFEDRNGALRKSPEECKRFGANGVPAAVWVNGRRYAPTLEGDPSGAEIDCATAPQPTVAAVLAEREACAKLCDSYAKHLRACAYDAMATAAESCAESIRARTEGGAA